MLVASSLLSVATLLEAAPPPPDRPRGYGVVSVAFAHHPANGPLYHRVSPPLGGNSWDVSGGAGVYLSRAIAIEGELMYGGTVAAPQRFSYFTSDTYTEEAHDLVLNALVLAHPDTARRVAILAGGGYAWTHTSEVSVTHYDSFGRLSAGSPTSSWWHGPSVTFGVEVAAFDSAHASVSPSLRVRVFKRPTADEGWNGLGAWTFQLGATAVLR